MRDGGVCLYIGDLDNWVPLFFGLWISCHEIPPPKFRVLVGSRAQAQPLNETKLPKLRTRLPTQRRPCSRPGERSRAIRRAGGRIRRFLGLFLTGVVPTRHQGVRAVPASPSGGRNHFSVHTPVPAAGELHPLTERARPTPARSSKPP